jgi:hypothetical protein
MEFCPPGRNQAGAARLLVGHRQAGAAVIINGQSQLRIDDCSRIIIQGDHARVVPNSEPIGGLFDDGFILLISG